MKRTITLLAAIVLLVSLLIPAAATESMVAYDSSNVDNDIRQLIGLSEEDIALRIYQTDLIGEFTTKESINDILPGDPVATGIIATSNNGQSFQCWKIWSAVPKGYTDFSTRLNEQAIAFYLNGDLTAYLGADTVVKNVFYLNGEPWNMGTALYYKTNKGDYVYFCHDQIEPCLFSAHVFTEYLKLVAETGYDIHNKLSTNALRFDVWMRFPYDPDSPFFNPDWNIFPKYPAFFGFYICMAMLVLIAVVILIPVMIYRKKYKKHNPYEENNGTNFDPDFVIAHTINDHVYDPENLPVNPN